MADWDFVAPDDEVPKERAPAGTVEFRPNRMALGCSAEIIQEQISLNAKKARLTKLLKRQGDEGDGLLSTSKTGATSGDEAHESKSAVTRLSVVAQAPLPEPVKQLTASQKKRQKRKLKEHQQRLLNS